MMNQFLDISPVVKKALENNEPVVALESTIIAHGMPYPQNVETARKVEQIVLNEGATPATIAILGGRIKVGLNDSDIETLGKKGRAVIKVSRRDMPYIVSQGLDGATTVASTMIGAAMAGIKVFATGGIGGVHRGAGETMDISADLQELAHTPVAVISAGVKSILDIGLTLEYLETQGVPVLGYQTKEFPAFYTRRSGFNVDYEMADVASIAKLMQAKWEMGLRGGLIIANPIPEIQQMDETVINTAIEQALAEAKEQGIHGKESTPFLLARVKELTEGDSLVSNIGLVFNNAKLAGKLAVAFTRENESYLARS